MLKTHNSDGQGFIYDIGLVGKKGLCMQSAQKVFTCHTHGCPENTVSIEIIAISDSKKYCLFLLKFLAIATVVPA